MWIVRLALRRPYTFIVMAILIGIMGGISIVTTPTGIFPYINIPMVGVIWTCNGILTIQQHASWWYPSAP